MKRKVLVSLIMLGLAITGMFVGRHLIMANNTTSSQIKQTDQEISQDDQKEEPNYVGSIKVNETDEQDEIKEQNTLQKLAKISQKEAENIALKEVSGTIIKTSLDNENGYLVYSVEIKDLQGKIYDVKVDAGNGKVLKIDQSDKDENQEVEETTDKDSIYEEKDDLD